MNTCEKCKWWGDPEDNINVHKVCFRYPPIGIANREMGRFRMQGGLEPWSLTAYPTTGADAYCGEWEARESEVRQHDLNIKPKEPKEPEIERRKEI